MVATCGVLAVLLVAGTQPAGASGSRYQVRRGDTLSEIASRLGVSMSRLVAANGLSNADLVFAGTYLRVPTSSGGGESGGSGGSGGTTHTVRSGETLSEIAAHFGLSTSALADANGIRNADVVFVGTRLRIPSGGGASSGGGGGGGSSSGSTSGLPKRLRNSPTRLAYIPTFDHWSAYYGVPADLAKAVTWLESGWQQGVVSSTGAIGIGQLMPATVVTMNDIMGTNLSAWVPAHNIRMTVRYLALLLRVTGGNTRRTLAGYYQGLASVERNGLYSSTIAYIDGVQSLRQRFR